MHQSVGYFSSPLRINCTSFTIVMLMAKTCVRRRTAGVLEPSYGVGTNVFLNWPANTILSLAFVVWV